MVCVITCGELGSHYVVSSVAFGSPDNFAIAPKTLVSKFINTYQTSGTQTDPAAKTKSIGLPANAQLMSLPERPKCRTTLEDSDIIRSGGVLLNHLDNCIVTCKLTVKVRHPDQICLTRLQLTFITK